MALSFLAEDWGFSGPELTADGVAYHRVGLHVEMGYWAWKNERAGGLGPAGAAPEGAGTLYVIRKRIAQHAMALRALIAHLDDGDSDALFSRCSRRRPRPTAGNDTLP